LKEADKRGDIIRLVSDPSKMENLINSNGAPTMFGREVKWLKKNGYEFKRQYAVKASK